MHTALFTLAILSIFFEAAQGAPILKAVGSKALPYTIIGDVQPLELTSHTHGKRGGLLDAIPGILTLVGGILDGVLQTAESSLTPITSLLLAEQPHSSSESSHVMTASSTASTQVYLLRSNASGPNISTDDAMVTLHVPLFIDSALVDMCLTYDPNPVNSSSISARPCTSNVTEHASQLFIYDTTTNGISPIFNVSAPAAPTNQSTLPDNSTASPNNQTDVVSDDSPANNTWVIQRDAQLGYQLVSLPNSSMSASNFLVFVPAQSGPQPARAKSSTPDATIAQSSSVYDGASSSAATTELPITAQVTNDNTVSDGPTLVILFTPSGSAMPVVGVASPGPIADRPDLQSEEASLEGQSNSDEPQPADATDSNEAPAMAASEPSDEPCEEED